MSPYIDSQIYSLRNIFSMASRFLHRTSLPTHRSAYRFTHPASPIGPNRSGLRLVQPIWPTLSLSLSPPPQAQLEALRDLRDLPDLPDYCFGAFWLYSSLALLDLFNSARFDPYDRLVCSQNPSQLPRCRGIGASSAAFSSAWASVVLMLPPICFLSRPSWLSPP